MHAPGRNMAGTKLEPLFAAPTEDGMLLGLDFLLRYHATVQVSILGIKNYH